MIKIISKFESVLCLLVALKIGIALAGGEDHFFVLKMSFDERVRVLEEMGKSCDVKPTKAMLKEILLFEHDVHRETKCFLRCLVEWFDLHVVDAHHVDVESIMEFASALFPDTQDHIRRFLHECNVEISELDDKCEAAYSHLVCMHKKLIQNGIDVPNFEQ